MFVRRTRGGDLAADRELTTRLVDRVRESGESGLRVWTPPAHVSFGRRDANADGFEDAVDRAEELGFQTTVRQSGGRAVAFTEGTLAVALVSPTTSAGDRTVNDGGRSGIGDRYATALDALQRAIRQCGVDAERGEPPNSFCPGSHSLQVDGRKVVGLAQRVRNDVALLAGVVIVHDEGGVASVLAPVYDALDVPFDEETVGSLAAAGGVSEASHVADAVVGAVRGGDQ